MNFLLRHAAGLSASLLTKFTSTGRKQRNRFAFVDGAYQSLEKRNLLATFIVTTLQDTVANDGLVSLREAITAANTNAAFSDAVAGDASGDTIGFAPQLGNQTIQITDGELNISDDLRIIGNVTLDAQNNSRIFSINTSENVLLAGLTFVNGETNSFFDRFGGAIEVTDGNVQISQSEFRSSSATGSASQGGAIYASNSTLRIGRTIFTGNRADLGGAIFTLDSDVNLFQSTFTSNRSGGGGAVYLAGGRLSTFQSTFDNNSGGFGGAIAANGELFVTESTFTDNVATGIINGGGGILSFGGDSSVTAIRDSEFVGNSARRNGGAFSLRDDSTAFVTDTRFEGNVAGVGASVDTSASGGGIYSLGDLFVSGGRIASNSALDNGGGVGADAGRVLLNEVVVQDNLAGRFGGGISGVATNISLIDASINGNRVNNPNVAAGTLTTSDTLLGGGLYASGQEARTVGIFSVFIKDTQFDNNFAGHGGGGIATEGTGLRIVDSSFTDNVVQTTVAPVRDSGETFSGGGGAIWHRSLSGRGRELLVVGTSFSTNRISFGGQAVDFGSRLTFLGGGISTIDSDVLISANTFVGNGSDGSGGALAQTGSSTLRVVDTDFVGNRAGNAQISANEGFESIGSDDSPNGLGGALYSDNAATAAFPVRIFGGEFRGNFATDVGGAIFATSSNLQSSLLIRANNAGEGTRFVNNRALREDGGAFAGIGVGLNARDAFFSNNLARDGGAIFIESGRELRLAFSEFRENDARRNGGAIDLVDIDFIDFENLFVDNTATNGADVFEQPI